MKKWAMLVDVAKCENCNNCFLACKDEHVGNDFPGYAAAQPLHGHRWIDLYRTERGQAPMVEPASMPAMCNQCDDAPCIKASTNGAVYKRDDGIVIIDPDKAVGQKQLVAACPYGAIAWNEEKQLPQKWIFDAHLLDSGWQAPRCVQVCPTGALKSVKVDDAELSALVADQALEVLHPEYATQPRVFYRNLYRFTKCFIGGSVAAETDGVEDCVEGANVRLQHRGRTLSEQVTDAYGDFKFDRLEPASGAYQIQIEKAGFEPCVVAAELGKSLYLGVINLTPDATATASQMAATGCAKE